MQRWMKFAAALAVCLLAAQAQAQIVTYHSPVVVESPAVTYPTTTYYTPAPTVTYYSPLQTGGFSSHKCLSGLRK